MHHHLYIPNSLEAARSYFSKFSSLFHLKNHHSKDVNFKFQLKRSSHLDVRINCVYIVVAYILLCNYGYHNQTCFPYNLLNGTLFSCKICHGLRGKYELSCDSKISKSLKKNVGKIGLGSFKVHTNHPGLPYYPIFYEAFVRR